MKPLRIRLQESRKRLGLPWDVLERDYLLAWILAGISQTEVLRDTLVFKGETALKKCWFGDYRFSEDLDFTAVGSFPTGAEMEAAVKEACARAVKLLDPYVPVEIVCERHIERDPHPGGQEAFDIRARFPWHRTPQTNVMVEIATDEKLLLPPPTGANAPRQTKPNLLSSPRSTERKSPPSPIFEWLLKESSNDFLRIACSNLLGLRHLL